VPDGERPAHRSTRRDHGAPADVLAQVRQHALDASESLFAVDPMLGDPLVQRGVDEFVEQVVDALRVIAQLSQQRDPSWAGAEEHRAGSDVQHRATPDVERPGGRDATRRAGSDMDRPRW
jgi:hypothetical protein